MLQYQIHCVHGGSRSWRQSLPSSAVCFAVDVFLSANGGAFRCIFRCIFILQSTMAADVIELEHKWRRVASTHTLQVWMMMYDARSNCMTTIYSRIRNYFKQAIPQIIKANELLCFGGRFWVCDSSVGGCSPPRPCRRVSILVAAALFLFITVPLCLVWLLLLCKHLPSCAMHHMHVAPSRQACSYRPRCKRSSGMDHCTMSCLYHASSLSHSQRYEAN